MDPLGHKDTGDGQACPSPVLYHIPPRRAQNFLIFCKKLKKAQEIREMLAGAEPQQLPSAFPAQEEQRHAADPGVGPDHRTDIVEVEVLCAHLVRQGVQG